ncbi:tetratricopeptide repeat protein [Novipirellula artificiosorum]|uniref:Tetratricopeptide repeat protein n=1 Tax=Novipirellula artificiosorum TaxID=2528016 RepID=A0A5C6E178_9BACT|nr:tetratricopeptide repeat protein [Novipirellula artificiosorum]TWU41727.1 Tetratricopeptide repeat protein [Novipirellula artificiosorum]
MDPDDDTQRSDQPESSRDAGSLHGIRVALAGRFGSMLRREAANVLRSFGAEIVDQKGAELDWVVIGADQSPLSEADLLSESTRHAIALGTCELVHETGLWQRLGLVDLEPSTRRYYTPAMLAHLLGISVRIVRRWQRLGLITPVETLHRLPYFDFAEVATAKRLAKWIAAGESATVIEQRLVEWVELLPNIHRPLDQLSILVEGKQVLLRGGEGLIEPGGQLRFDFDAFEQGTLNEKQINASAPPPTVLSIVRDNNTSFPYNLEQADGDDEDELMSAAFQAEDAGDLQLAIDFYHAMLSRDGPHADLCFQLGELLYRRGEAIAARERYYTAIELDPDFVEARASLGIVLAETDQQELAVAAFRGALEIFPDYADVHYHLARTLDDLARCAEAVKHWRRFLSLYPDSPWAAEARMRLDGLDD